MKFTRLTPFFLAFLLMDASVREVLSRPSRPPTPNDRPLRIVKAPEDQFKQLGGAAQFKIQVVPSVGVSFQWRRDGVLLAGETDRVLNIQSVSTDVLGGYDCIITTEMDSMISPAATLTAFTTDIMDLPPELRDNLPTNTVSIKDKRTLLIGNLVVISRTVAGVPNDATNCPAPYVGRMRFPDGTGTVEKIPTASYYAYDLTDEPTNLTYHGDYGDFDCENNLPNGLAVDVAYSQRFFFYVYFPVRSPAPGTPYYLFLNGFKN